MKTLAALLLTIAPCCAQSAMTMAESYGPRFTYTWTEQEQQIIKDAIRPLTTYRLVPRFRPRGKKLAGVSVLDRLLIDRLGRVLYRLSDRWGYAGDLTVMLTQPELIVTGLAVSNYRCDPKKQDADEDEAVAECKRLRSLSEILNFDLANPLPFMTYPGGNGRLSGAN